VKKIHLIAWLALFGGGTLPAQTNIDVASKPPRPPTLIDSVSGDFDLTAKRAIYRGNVRVDDPQMKLTCEQLTADLPQAGGHINHLVALTNVVMDSVDEKGQTNHATSDMAVYDYKVVNGVTNETVTLTGNAKVENAQGWMTGEPIVWDRVNNSIHADNQKMILRQAITTALVNTNAPAVHQTNLPITKTNFPPGTIQNIDLMTLPQSGPTTTH
jgi:lipopolysaccharide transport protein LptA